MKNFIIYLPTYNQSVLLAQRALTSAEKFNWDVELFQGVNGKLFDWSSTNLAINQENAKCRDMMSRPGVRGCFMSHYFLWKKCLEINEPIGIFEHDIEFNSAPDSFPPFNDVLKLEGFSKKKARPAGEWYEGARAYILSPDGAKKLVNWVNLKGALPADVAIGLDVVDIKLDQSDKVVQQSLYGKSLKRENSFTWNLEGMR